MTNHNTSHERDLSTTQWQYCHKGVYENVRFCKGRQKAADVGDICAIWKHEAVCLNSERPTVWELNSWSKLNLVHYFEPLMHCDTGNIIQSIGNAIQFHNMHCPLCYCKAIRFIFLTCQSDWCVYLKMEVCFIPSHHSSFTMPYVNTLICGEHEAQTIILYTVKYSCA